MPFAPHLVRRGAVYYWRKRLPPCCGDRHVCLSLKTTNANRARMLAAQLDATFMELVMLDATFLSTPQLDAMLRSVIATHSAKRWVAATYDFIAPSICAE